MPDGAPRPPAARGGGGAQLGRQRRRAAGAPGARSANWTASPRTPTSRAPIRSFWTSTPRTPPSAPSSIPGCARAWTGWRRRAIALGCVTNKAAQFTLPLLTDLGVIDRFGIVVSGDTLPQKKPDPAPLLHAAAHFGVDPTQSLMVGDSVSDVKAARAAGFGIVCMSYGYNHGGGHPRGQAGRRDRLHGRTSGTPGRAGLRVEGLLSMSPAPGASGRRWRG